MKNQIKGWKSVLSRIHPLGEVPTQVGDKRQGQQAPTAGGTTVSMLQQIAPQAPKSTTQTDRSELPPLIAYDVVSVWVKSDVDDNGEVTSQTFASITHPVGKVGAGLNAAVDRIRAAFAKRGDKGYNDLEGYELFCTALEPAKNIQA